MFERARLRLALSYAGALAAILLIVGGIAYLVLRSELDNEINNSLDDAVRSLQATPIGVLVNGGAVPDTHRNGHDDGDDQHAPPAGSLPSDVFFLVVGPDGNVVSNPRNVEEEHFPIAQLVSDASNGPSRTDFNSDGHHYRVVSTRLAPDGTTLVAGRSLSARDYQLRVLAIVLLSGGGAGVLLAALGGFWLAGRALVPIRGALETQRRFVSDASHELRTPVAVMKANAELLLRHPDQTVETNIDQVAAINEESDHMSRLVADLLMLARADEQRLNFAHERLNLDELLDSLVRDMRPLAEAKGVELTADLHGGSVEGDPQRLRQLATILLDNAIKFTPAGGQVRVRGWRDGRAVFSVADTGPGIPAKDQPRIFDRFFRSDEARSPEGGTGLGLAIAKTIAEGHHGRISVESTPGHGATFTVRLPK